MATLSQSRERYAQRQRLSDAVATEGRRTWGQIDTTNITASWQQLAPRLMVTLFGAQMAAASGSDEYVSSALDAQGIDVAPAGEVVPRRLAGTASDGRTLDTLLDEPRITTLTALSRGATLDRSLASGWAELDMILRTQVADAGRVSDGIATAARPTAGYVRMIQGKTCGRCAILAGRFYRYNQGFQRHPNCDCIHVPSRESIAGDLTTDPKRYFDDLDATEQDRLFGKGNAAAIRDGADMNRVVNATGRRGGMYTTADGRRATRELTGRSRRGAGGRGSYVRLVPEGIYRMAPDRATTIDLLRLHGYLR